MKQPSPRGLATVYCCLPKRQDCSPTLRSVRAELCQNLAKAPHQVLSAEAELKRQCRRRLLRTGWRRRTRLPRAGAVSPRLHPGLLHWCCPAQSIKCTLDTKRDGMETYSRPRVRGSAGEVWPSHTMPRVVQLAHGCPRSHFSFLDRQKLQLV